MQYYVPDLENLRYAGYNPLMNLATDMNEYHAKSGSNSMFDFSKGDPLKNTNIQDMHKDAGANLNFHGATGNQEMGVINRF